MARTLSTVVATTSLSILAAACSGSSTHHEAARAPAPTHESAPAASEAETEASLLAKINAGKKAFEIGVQRGRPRAHVLFGTCDLILDKSNNQLSAIPNPASIVATDSATGGFANEVGGVDQSGNVIWGPVYVVPAANDIIDGHYVGKTTDDNLWEPNSYVNEGVVSGSRDVNNLYRDNGTHQIVYSVTFTEQDGRKDFDQPLPPTVVQQACEFGWGPTDTHLA